MEETEYLFVMEFLREQGGDPLHQEVVREFSDAVRGAWFEGLRRGRLPDNHGPLREKIVPLWSEERGRPYLEGVAVELRSGQGHLFSKAFGNTYFAPLARRSSGPLVEAGILSSGEIFRYRLTAFPRPQEGPVPLQEEAQGMKVRPREKPLRLAGQRPLSGLLASATPTGAAVADDFPFFLPSSVLEEMRTVAREAEEVERGGILIGELCRDTESPEIFALVNAQVTARHTEASATRLTFTHETWSAVSDAIQLRGRNHEQWLGYWHSHPFPERCRSCERREECPQTPLFYSSEDHFLHRTVFSAPFAVGLVITPLAGRDAPTLKAFGWRDGVITERDIAILKD